MVGELPMIRRAALWRRARGQRGITLIELLIGLIISGVLSTMVILGWVSLTNSYSYSVASNNARDNARQALSRMAREIRDAEAPPTLDEAALLRCRARWIKLYTTFNEAGNSNPTKAPHLVMYRLYPDGELWRFEDLDNSGSIGGSFADFYPDSWPQNTFSVSEQATGEGAMLMCSNVVNDKAPSASNPTPMFRYSRYLANGTIDVQNSVIYAENRSEVVSVQIHLLVDLNPSHSPIYADLQTSAQIRNQR